MRRVAVRLVQNRWIPQSRGRLLMTVMVTCQFSLSNFLVQAQCYRVIEVGGSNLGIILQIISYIDIMQKHVSCNNQNMKLKA